MQCLTKLLLALLMVAGSVHSQEREAPEPEPLYAGVRRPVVAAMQTALVNVGIWAYGHYVLNGYWTNISYKSVEANLRHGFEWDPNAFFNNFFSHPYHGQLYFNSARTNGMNFWESTAYAWGGSAMWELFMESEFPAFNDWIMTSTGGIALGEALYRLSSQTLDDRATGWERVWREAVALAVNPMGGLNRLITGEMFRTRTRRGHIRNPLHGYVGFGGRGAIRGAQEGDFRQSAVLQFGLQYGAQFEDKSYRRPFDFFTFRLWTSRGKDIRNLIIWEKAMLFGKTFVKDNGRAHTLGLFQYYDMMNTEIIKIGSMSLGAGYLSRFPFGNGMSLEIAPHAGAIILGASNTEYSDPTEDRDYNYGWGFQAKAQALLKLARLGELLVGYNYFGIYTLEGADGVERLNVLDVIYNFPIWAGFGLAGEFFYYRRNANYDEFPDVTKSIHGFRALVTYRF